MRASSGSDRRSSPTTARASPSYGHTRTRSPGAQAGARADGGGGGRIGRGLRGWRRAGGRRPYGGRRQRPLPARADPLGHHGPGVVQRPREGVGRLGADRGAGVPVGMRLRDARSVCARQLVGGHGRRQAEQPERPRAIAFARPAPLHHGSVPPCRRPSARGAGGAAARHDDLGALRREPLRPGRREGGLAVERGVEIGHAAALACSARGGAGRAGCRTPGRGRCPARAGSRRGRRRGRASHTPSAATRWAAHRATGRARLRRQVPGVGAQQAVEHEPLRRHALAAAAQEARELGIEGGGVHFACNRSRSKGDLIANHLLDCRA